MTSRPFIHMFLEKPLSGPEIERRSFEAIDREVHHAFSSDQWEVVRRMIHTTGDRTMGDLVRFSPDAIAAGVEALRQGRPIFTDSNMIRAGLSMARLKSAHAGYDSARIHCHVADADVAAQSAQTQLPRSYFAVRKARPMLDGGIAVFGNAPVALLELNRMILEDRICPALVLAMPVGFVHVIESKEELMTLSVPHVAVVGTRGGSTLAVATLHALCTLAARPNTEASA